MSILKTILVVALLAATVSAAPGGRKGRRAHQRGRTAEGDVASSPCGFTCPTSDVAVAEAAATPEAAEANAAVSDALTAASDAVETLASESLSTPEAAAVGAEIVENLADAAALAADAPQAQEVQAAVVANKGEEAFDELEKYLFFAKKVQKELEQFGETYTVEKVVEKQTKLHKFLEKAQFFAQQNFVAYQQAQAIEEGAAPVEVAAIAPAGRRMGQRQKGRRFFIV